MQKNGLIRKIKVYFKIYDVTTWLTNNCKTHIAQISRSKGNPTMVFGQLIDMTWEIFFLKNHTQNLVEKLVPDPFLKNQIEQISGSMV